MSEQIKSLVERHIPAAYRGTREVQRAVDGIVRDLDGLRSNIARQVRSAGQQAGVSTEQVNNLLYGTGLADRPAPTPAPAAAAASTGGVLETEFAKIVAFARQHGYRG
jgi:hypothetical protein